VVNQNVLCINICHVYPCYYLEDRWWSRSF